MSFFSDLDLDQCDSRLECVTSVEEAAKAAHALVICTEWEEFKVIFKNPITRYILITFFKLQHLNYKQLYDQMCKPAFLFDGRLMVSADDVAAIGFHVEQIGRQSNHPKISF